MVRKITDLFMVCKIPNLFIVSKITQLFMDSKITNLFWYILKLYIYQANFCRKTNNRDLFINQMFY